MKLNKIVIAGLFILLAGSSCRKYLDDAYVNPNAPVAVDPSLVLPAISANMARGIQFDSRGVGNYVQNWVRTASGDNWDRMGYTANSDFGGEIWRTHYWNLGQNLKNMIRDAIETKQYEYAGVAYATFAWSWLHLADYHGNVIFRQAFDQGRLTFDYDDQDVVYDYVITIADSAVYWLNQAKPGMSTSSLPTADRFFYSGDINKWIRFAYGIKAKALHRYFNKSNYDPSKVIEAVDASFQSPADDATVKFANGALSDEANFYGPRRGNMQTFRASLFTVQLMDGTLFEGAKDPRLEYIFRPSTDGVFRGILPGAGEPTSTPADRRTANFWGRVSTATISGGVDTSARTFFKNNSEFPILTYAELQFLKAEAAYLTGDKAAALDAYKKGLQGHYEMLTTRYTGYRPMADNWVGFIDNEAIVPKSPEALTLDKIMMQKYIALWGHGFVETWVDLRRYNYSQDVYRGFALPTSLFPDNGGLPANRVRPRYNSEYLWNVEALQVIGGLDPDYHTREVWFMKP